MRTRHVIPWLACLAILIMAAAGKLSAAQSNLARQAETLKKKLSFTPEELGPEFVLADYGRDNPACWTMKDAPNKLRRRLAPLVQSGTAGPETHLCYFEYVKKGTHDDILIKIYIFQSEKEARAALKHSYLARMSQKLEKHGLDPARAHKNFVYLVTASESNLDKAKKISGALKSKLAKIE